VELYLHVPVPFHVALFGDYGKYTFTIMVLFYVTSKAVNLKEGISKIIDIKSLKEILM
jgi:hypothetical protein